MKLRRLFAARLSFPLASAIAALLSAPSANAADGSWLGDSAGNWTDGASWTGGIIADGADFTATFGNVIAADRIVTLGADRTIGNITASDTSQNFTISGANILTLDRSAGTPVVDVTASGRTLTIASVTAGNDGLLKIGAGSLALTAANTYSGTTMINGGAIALSGSGTINASTGLTLQGGSLTLTNTSGAEAALDRVSGSDITSNGGTISFANASGSTVYAETIGSVALTGGQLNLTETTNQASTGSQTLILSGLTRTGATNSSAVAFSAPTTAPNATTNRIQVSGASGAGAGQNSPGGVVIGPWASTGTSAIVQTDYAVYDASGYVLPANITASAQSTWTTAANAYTHANASGSAVNGRLTATRTIDSLRNTTAATTVTATNATDLINLTGHGFLAGDAVVLGGTAPTGLTSGVHYFVINPTANNFQLSTTSGGGASLFTADGASLNVTGAILVSTGNNLETNGILNGVSNTLSIAATGTGAITAPGITGGQIYINTGGSRAFTLTTNNNTIVANLAIDISAPINDNGGPVTLVKTGDNSVLRLTGTSNYSGGTVINAGILFVSGDSALGATTGDITLNGGQLRFTANNLTFNADRDLIVGPVGGSLAPVGNQTVINFSGKLTGAGTLSMGNTAGAGGRNAFLNSLSNDFTGEILIPSVSTVIGFSSLVDTSDAGDIVLFKGSSGTGTGAFQWNNTPGMAPLTLNNRSIQIVNDTGTTFGSAIVSNVNTTQAITVNTDLISIGATARTLQLDAAAGPTNVFAGKITDGTGGGTLSLTKSGAGIWSVSGTNTHSGTTTVSAGTLELSNGAAIADTGAVSLANVATAILKLNANETIGSLAGGGTTGGTVNLQANTLTVGGGTGSFGGGIQGVDGALTKTVAGTLTLTGANIYTGATTVSGGQLTVSGTGTLAGTSGLSVSGGAAFNYLPTAIGTTLALGSASTLNLADGSALGLAWNTTIANQIAALGAATVGSTTGVALNMTGTYNTGTTYPILSAASGLDTGKYTFLNPIDYTMAVVLSPTSVTVTPTTVSPLGAAYWMGTATTGLTKIWAASDGSADSNWSASDGGSVQSLVPGSGADVIISSSTVALAPTATTLGANMTIKSLTIADTTNGLSLDADAYTLTITPLVATAGIVMNANVPASTIAAKVALGASQTWTNDSASPLTVSGVVSGAFVLTKAGTGLVTLSGVNTYSGGTTLNDNSGTLDISGAGSLGSGTYAQPIAIGTGSTLKFSSSVSGATQTLSGAITGLGGLTHAPSVNRSFLVLSNAGSSYSGVTSISAGRVQLATGAGLSPNTSFVVTGNATSGGQLFFGAGGTVSNNLSIAGVGYVDSDLLSTKAGAVRFSTTGSILSGTVTLSGDARVGNINGTGAATISGQITGSAGIEFYGATNTANVTHTYTLSNAGTANDYTGNTTITAADSSTVRTGGRAALSLGANEQIPHGAGNGIVVFSGADADHVSTLDLNGFSETLNGVSNVSAAGANIRNNAAGASVLTIGDLDTSSSFSGVISNTTGTLAITKIGTGTLNLSGANSYSGNTTVNAGTLVLADNAQLKFVTGATSGDNNSVSGAGTITIDGDFNIDTTLTDAAALTSGSWTLVDVSTLVETFNPSFSILGAGWSEAGNVWSKIVGGRKYTFDEATGILTLASYASWINGFFPGETNPLIIGAGADPDFDGIANSVEMVIGGNPATGMDTALLPTIELVTDPVSTPTIPAGNYLLFTYRRSDLSVAAGVTADCETDTDLVAPWTAATGAPGVVIQVDDNATFTPPAATDTDRVRVYVPRGANTKLFGRLNVVVP
jgi:autotransporter-associated beta strand protein